MSLVTSTADRVGPTSAPTPAAAERRLLQLSRQLPTDDVEALELASNLAACAPERETLTGATYQVVLHRSLPGSLLSYGGQVELTETGDPARQSLCNSLRAFSALEGLEVRIDDPLSTEWVNIPDYAPAVDELGALWDVEDCARLAHALTQAATWLTQMARFFERSDRTSAASCVPALRRHLNQVAVLCLDPTQMTIGQRLLARWTGSTSDLLDTVAAVAVEGH